MYKFYRNSYLNISVSLTRYSADGQFRTSNLQMLDHESIQLCMRNVSRHDAVRRTYIVADHKLFFQNVKCALGNHRWFLLGLLALCLLKFCQDQLF